LEYVRALAFSFSCTVKEHADNTAFQIRQHILASVAATPRAPCRKPLAKKLGDVVSMSHFQRSLVQGANMRLTAIP
jgi:hypothetical protein